MFFRRFEPVRSIGKYEREFEFLLLFFMQEILRADYSGYLFAVLVTDCKQTGRIICRGKESKENGWKDLGNMT